MSRAQLEDRTRPGAPVGSAVEGQAAPGRVPAGPASPAAAAARGVWSWGVVWSGVVVVGAAAAMAPAGLRPFTTLRWAVVGCAAALAAAQVRWRPPRAFALVGAAFLAWMALATALAVDPLTALVGHGRRHLGLAGWVVCGLAFLAGTGLPRQAHRLLGRAAVVAGLVTGVGVAADLAGWNPAGVSFAGGRIGGLLGQPTYLGALALLLGPVAIGAACDLREPRAWRRAAAVAAGACGVALAGSQTRGAWAGALVAALVIFLARTPSPDGRSRARKRQGGNGRAGARGRRLFLARTPSPGDQVRVGKRRGFVRRLSGRAAEPTCRGSGRLATTYATSSGKAARTASVRPSPEQPAHRTNLSRTRPSGDQDGAPKRRAGAVAAAVAAAVLLFTVGHAGSRLASAGDGTDGGLGARLDEWALAASVVADHPLVGAGPEGYRVVAPGHIDDAYARRHGRDDLVDRAHSAPLDVAAAGGLPAAALYVALLALVVAACVRAIRLPAPHPVVVGAAAGLTAWVVQQVVAFPIAEVDPVAWLLAGVVAAAVAVPPGATAVAAVPSIDRVGRAGRLVGGGCAAVLLVGGALAVWTDVSLARAERLAADGDDAAALVAADRATRLRPDDVDGWYVAARLAAERTSLLGVDAALDRVEAGRARLPTDPALRDLEERLLVERALRSGLPEDRRAAERASRRAVAADPSGPAHYRSLGLVLAAGGHDEAAASALRRALDLDPGDRTSRDALDAPTAPDPGDRRSGA